jgi:hypothetical protein
MLTTIVAFGLPSLRFVEGYLNMLVMTNGQILIML